MTTVNVGVPAGPAHGQAASDITSGALVHERGGLEADVSAYAGLVKVTGGATSAVTSTATGEDAIQGLTTVEAVASGPNALAATESNKVLTNEGAGAEVAHTLPTAAAGLLFEAVVQAAQSLKIVANSGDTIRAGGQVSKAAGYIASSTVGDTIRLVAINATEWIAAPCVGTWTLETA